MSLGVEFEGGKSDSHTHKPPVIDRVVLNEKRTGKGAFCLVTTNSRVLKNPDDCQ